MVKIKSISIEQAKSRKRTIKPKPIVQEYMEILNSLQSGEAKEIDAKTEKETPATIKNRILRLKKSMNMNDLEVKRVGTSVMFWRESNITN